MKRFILFTLLALFILTTVMGPFTINSQGAQSHFMNTAWAQLGPPPELDPDDDDDFAFPFDLPKPDPQPDVNASLNCGILFSGKFIDCIAIVVNTIFEFFGLVLGGAGVLLDKIMVETVIEMGANLEKVGAITEGFKTFRDLANIVIIFAFLAIGIATILQLQNYTLGKLLPTLIIVALLVNFSLFFTRAIIDGGNLLATRFYQEIQKCGESNCDVSDQFMEAISLTTLYNIDFATGEASLGLATPALNAKNIITIGLMGSILFLVTTFVFLAAALLLVSRFVILIFLMVLAPLAFVSMAIPFLRGQANKWWGMLINHTLFAPAFFILIWFVLTVLRDLKNSIFQLSDDSNFADIVADGDTLVASNFSIFLTFIIAIGFMIAALFIAKQLSIKGGEAAMNAGKGLAGLAAANTAGRLSGALGRGYSRLQERVTSTRPGRFARAAVSVATLGLASDAAIRGTFKAGEDAKYGGPKSAAQMRADKRKRVQELGSLGTRRRAQKESETGAPSAAATVRSLGKEDLESMKTRAIAQPKFAANLSPAQLETIMKSDKFSPAEKQNIRARREEGLLAKVNAGDIDSVLSGKPDDIAKLPPKVLTHPEVMKHLTKAMLARMIIVGLDESDRNTIRLSIETATTQPGGTPTSAQQESANWLQGPAGNLF